MIKVLSIDGGGIRGIVPALILAKLEQRTGKPISQLFDLVAGTSTGGILALGLVKPGVDGKPAYAASDLARLYEERGRQIFSRASWRRVLPVGNLLDEKYPSEGIDAVLEEFFGEDRLKSALTDVLITSYEIERRFPLFFRSRVARTNPDYDFPMRKVARATSAAPTYFEPCQLETDNSASYYALVDGGVYANNPALCALVEARRIYGNEDILLISLGTGSLTRPLHYSETRHWGVAKWAKPVLDIAFDGVSSTVDYQLRVLLPKTPTGRRYYRMQPTLPAELEDMDNASERNIRGLKLLAEREIRERAECIREISELLLE